MEILAGRAGRITADGTTGEFSAAGWVEAARGGGDGRRRLLDHPLGCGRTRPLDAAGNLIEQVGRGARLEPHGLALDADGSVWVALGNGSVAHIQP
ncbi:hypothetical protein E1218_21860 [Kribbella turkmenica]|uniref:SMP-30/Gluconolactonase/LRE-like region domain-containing protein n=1 Tax=Kribbella turkmenica TaxID=2530375 RepID=A0A4V2YEW6_9ACTN|nr:hypothetical protein [Kribbella turkmenica]TDD20867.1 hypothetical protein E1218_21860 [Kribbella turkmenica]